MRGLDLRIHQTKKYGSPGHAHAAKFALAA